MQVNFGLLGDIEAPKPLTLGSDIMSGLQLAQQQKQQQIELALKQHKDFLDTQKTASQVALQTAQTGKAQADTSKSQLETAYMPVMNQARLMNMQTEMQKNRVETQKTLGEIKLQPLDAANKQLDMVKKQSELSSNMFFNFGQLPTDQQQIQYASLKNAAAKIGVPLPPVYNQDAKNAISFNAATSKDRLEMVKTAINEKNGQPFAIRDTTTGQLISSPSPQDKLNAAANQAYTAQDAKDWGKYKETLRGQAEAAHGVLDDLGRVETIMRQHGLDVNGQIRGHFTPFLSKDANEVDSLLNDVVLQKIGMLKGVMSRATNMSLGMLQKSKVSITQDPQAAANRVAMLKAASNEVADRYDNQLPAAEAAGIRSTSKFVPIVDQIAAINPVFSNGKINPEAINARHVYNFKQLSDNLDKGIPVKGIDRDTAVINGETHTRSEFINVYLKLNPGKTPADAIKRWIEVSR